MSLQLILGSAGSGKSEYLLKRMIEESMERPKENFFLLVPEQFTMETQKDVVNMHPRHGTMNLDIVSFGRLAYRIFEELSIKNMTVLDDLGKSMLLRKAVRGRKKEFTVFGRNLNKAGFFDQVKSMLSELYQYGVGEEELISLLNKTADRPILNRKLHDLLLCYQAFQEELKEDTIPSEELLDVLCRLVPESKLLSGSTIALDGFTGFTPIQYRLLALLMRHAGKVYITVTIDPQEGPYEERSSEDLFYLSRNTIKKLTKLREEGKVAADPDVILSGKVPCRFQSAPGLALLEQHVLRGRNVSFLGAYPEVSLHEAVNPEEEARFLATEIYDLVRERGLHYRDIAVVAGDVEKYRFYIEKAFSDCEIPYFIDYKKHLSDHPAVALLLAALSVLEKNYSYDAMFWYLKNMFAPLPAEQVDELENYVLALGISGRKKWESAWDRDYRGSGELDFEALNQWRQAAAAPLISLQEKLRKKGRNVEDCTKALVEFLMELKVEEKLSEAAAELLEEGQLEASREYEQAYGLILQLFDQIVGLIGKEELPFSQYKDILETGFQEIKVGLIPPALDRVVVGDMERTRLNQIQVLFFAGVNDGDVPKTGSRGGLFSDQDRELLEKYQVELAPTAKKNCFIQRFYLYLALTKPSKRLVVSYSGADMEGKAQMPSSFIRELTGLFPDMEVKKCRLEETVTTKEGSRTLLLHGLFTYREGEEPSELWKGLYAWFYENQREVLMPLVEAAFTNYQEEKIDKAVSRALYGDFLSGSVSRLESYAACAYAQFLQYGLKLCEREEYTFGGADLGTVFHQSIALFFQKMKEKGFLWESLTEETRKALTEECVETVAGQYGNTVLESTARNSYQKKRILRIVDRTVWALSQQMLNGSFRPYETEMPFSAQDAEALRVPLSQDTVMYLNGRIDRVDTCEKDGRLYVKIMDYKSGSVKLEPFEVYYGLKLQLSLYLDAVTEILKRKNPGKEVIPAAMEYYQIQDPIVDWEENKEDGWLSKKILEALSPTGLLNKTPEAIGLYSQKAGEKQREEPGIQTEKLLEKGSRAVTPEQLSALTAFVRKKVKELGTDLAGGKIPVNPYSCQNRTACDYCAFRTVCGFDAKMPGFSYRRLRSSLGDLIFQEGGEVGHGEEMDKGTDKSH